jgi:transmembrane sensor
MQQVPHHINWELLIDLLEKPVAERQGLVASLSAEEQALIARLQQLKDDPLLTGALQLDTVQAWARMMEKETAPVRRLVGGWKKWVAAASLLLLVGAGGWLWMKSRHTQSVQRYQTVAQALANHAPSGKVQLITADGHAIEIDSVKQLKEKDGTLIRLQQGTVSYQGGQSNGIGSQSNSPLMNTLVVPRGYIYSLVLSDGSKVWLNADSKISFPVQFDKAERKVAIEGEAYFEVVHNDKWPFTVAIAGGSGGAVKVLGTSFDIKTYGKKIYTTLVTGSVLFTPPVANPVRLTPDQQTVFNVAGGVIQTKKVIAGDWIAWKDDDLVMIKMPLDELAAILERRYDVQVSFAEERLKNIQYNGAFHFTGNIIDILNSLEQTGNILFAVKNKTIVILPANGK